MGPTAAPASAVLTRPRSARRQAVYLLCAAGLMAGYLVSTTLLWIDRDFADGGPLSYDNPPAAAPADPAVPLATVEQRCRLTLDAQDDTIKLVAGVVGGTPYYGCYTQGGTVVLDATVLDARGFTVPERIAKQGGAWHWIGLVSRPGDLVLGGIGLAALLGLFFLYYRRPRPGAPRPARWWQTDGVSGLLGVTLLLPLTLPFRRAESRARRIRLLFQTVLGWSAFVVSVMFTANLGDRLSATVTGQLWAGVVFGWLGGIALVRPAGWGLPDTLAPGYRAEPVVAGPAGIPELGARPGPPLRPEPPSGPEPVVRPAERWTPDRSRRTPGQGPARVRPASGLPTFAEVGGMQALKAELDDTLGLLLAFGKEADDYRIAFNGMLLHGPPGVGKTFIAKAIAGEFGLSFAHIATGDLISKYVGQSAQNIRAVFADAARNVPCLLFFDEFDSVATRRDEATGEESRRVVNQLLQSLEEWRLVRELLIVAATNHLDQLDPAVVRPGRFDRRIRVDLPDLAARRAILHAQLAGRPLEAGVDLDDLAQRTAGRTPATIARVVEGAALAAFRRTTLTGAHALIDDADLRAALAGLGGQDRPTVEDWSWDRLVLADDVKAELRQVQQLVADPDQARAYGIEVPSGLLLAGPPGTGKTTVARVLAAQAGMSFYPQTAADLTSKWVGESEAAVVRLFARARDNAPSIIFIDEIDAIAGVREGSGSYLDRTLTQLLTEIDGMTEQRGVFVIAATNRPDILDPALVRGGRLSRTVTIPLPDTAQRRRLLGLFSARMPLREVDLDALARRTEGRSGADLEALCQQAALSAMLHRAGDEQQEVTTAAFDQALRQLASGTPEPPEESGGNYL